MISMIESVRAKHGAAPAYRRKTHTCMYVYTYCALKMTHMHSLKYPFRWEVHVFDLYWMWIMNFYSLAFLVSEFERRLI